MARAICAGVRWPPFTPALPLAGGDPGKVLIPLSLTFCICEMGMMITCTYWGPVRIECSSPREALGCPPSPSGRAGGTLAGRDTWEAQLTVLTTASPRREGGPHATPVAADVTMLSTAGGALAADFM